MVSLYFAPGLSNRCSIYPLASRTASGSVGGAASSLIAFLPRKAIADARNQLSYSLFANTTADKARAAS